MSGPRPQLRFGWTIEDKENYKFYKYGFMTMGFHNGIEGSVNWVKGKSFYMGLNMNCTKWGNKVFGGEFRPPWLGLSFQVGSNITNNSFWVLRPINVSIPLLIGKAVTICKGKRSWGGESFITGRMDYYLLDAVCIGYKF